MFYSSMSVTIRILHGTSQSASEINMSTSDSVTNMSSQESYYMGPYNDWLTVNFNFGATSLYR